MLKVAGDMWPMPRPGYAQKSKIFLKFDSKEDLSDRNLSVDQVLLEFHLKKKCY